LAAIRGLAFKYPVEVRRLTRTEARAFITGQAAQLPKIEDYWAVMRMLGLYRGPDLAAPERIYGDLSGFAAGAYDAYEDVFFQFEELDEQRQQSLFAHELCHALQNQHFDLRRYLIDMARRADANADQVLARQAVVEGEALYVDTIYQGRAAGSAPTRQQLADIVTAQTAWSPKQWEKAVQNPGLDEKMRARLQEAIATRKRMPPFMFELFFGAYVHGMAFIHAVHERGWTEVATLYDEYPPASTEQILHPEKWFAREEPVIIAWPAFDSDPLFADWQLLLENVLGERQWQVVFQQQGLESEMRAATAGWNGDRFAVFRHRTGGTYLMLMYTSWDTPADADEFAAAYRRLLEAKYPDAAAPAQLLMQGNDVLIVEGAADTAAGAFMDFNTRAARGK
jgi:hypothetical protein